MQLSNSVSDNYTQVEQDYIDLLSGAKKANMGTYVHMHRPETYEKVIRQEEYYPFRLESALLIQKAAQISSMLQDITQVIEIGPGSYTAMATKTIPFLKGLKLHSSFSNYAALDVILEYAQDACKIIKEQFPDIKTQAIERDLSSTTKMQSIESNQNNKGNKLLFGFSVIFPNNHDQHREISLKNVSSLLNENDYVIFGIDTNQDEVMLERAYNTDCSYELLLNTMHHLKNTFNLYDFDPEGFDMVYKWNKEESRVELFLKSKMKQIVKIRDQEFVIDKDKELNIINSRKSKMSHVEDLFNKTGLIIKEVVTFDDQLKDKFSMIIAQKK